VDRTLTGPEAKAGQPEKAEAKKLTNNKQGDYGDEKS